LLAGLRRVTELAGAFRRAGLGGAPGVQIAPKLAADRRGGGACICEQPDQGVDRYSGVEGQQRVHARFLRKVDVEERERQEQRRRQPHHRPGQTLADQVDHRDGGCAEQGGKQADIVGRVAKGCDPVVEEQVIERRMLVEVDRPLQQFRDAVVRHPHAERLVQPHPFCAKKEETQRRADQRDQDDKPRRPLFDVDFIIHWLAVSCSS
jgi:hypothetical protein